MVGAEDLATRIQDGFDDFDVAIATPDLMPVVGRLGRVLGPSGKMPNPKVGTVTMDVAKAIEESKAGKIEYRTDRNAIVHLVIGKRDFEERALLENYAAVIEELDPSEAVGRQGPLHPGRRLPRRPWAPVIRVDPSRTRDTVRSRSPLSYRAVLASGSQSAGGAATFTSVCEKSSPVNSSGSSRAVASA